MRPGGSMPLTKDEGGRIPEPRDRPDSEVVPPQIEVTPEMIESAFLEEIKSYYSDPWNRRRGSGIPETDAQDLIDGVLRRLFAGPQKVCLVAASKVAK